MGAEAYKIGESVMVKTAALKGRQLVFDVRTDVAEANRERQWRIHRWYESFEFGKDIEAVANHLRDRGASLDLGEQWSKVRAEMAHYDEVRSTITAVFQHKVENFLQWSPPCYPGGSCDFEDLFRMKSVSELQMLEHLVPQLEQLQGEPEEQELELPILATLESEEPKSLRWSWRRPDYYTVSTTMGNDSEAGKLLLEVWSRWERLQEAKKTKSVEYLVQFVSKNDFGGCPTKSHICPDGEREYRRHGRHLRPRYATPLDTNIDRRSYGVVLETLDVKYETEDLTKAVYHKVLFNSVDSGSYTCWINREHLKKGSKANVDWVTKVDAAEAAEAAARLKAREDEAASAEGTCVSSSGYTRVLTGG